MLSDSSIYFYTYRQFIQYIEPWPLSTDRSEAFAGVNLEEKQKSLSRTASPAKLVSRNFRVPILTEQLEI